MRTITCLCDKSFDVELPEEIDVDREPLWLDRILDGSFFAVQCPNCGTTIKPDLQVRIVSSRRKMDLLVLPDLNRISFYYGKTDIPAGSEVLIGFPELLERTRIVRDGLDPVVVEFLKYILVSKATEESDVETSPLAYYFEKDDGSLVFHLHGLRENEVAVLRLPEAKYAFIEGKKGSMASEGPFSKIAKGPYRSLRILETDDEETD